MCWLFNYLLPCIFLLKITVAAHINLYYTDGVSKNESENILRHSCLPLIVRDGLNNDQQIISYCISELPLKNPVKSSGTFSKYTFAQLATQNITSEQLYLWSAPIDVAERYQIYLNQLSTSNQTHLAKQVFYNCTLPRFGPLCQYEFPLNYSNKSSLNDIIQLYYHTYQYYSTNLTCYTHLQCNRGTNSSCLDWSEICNGHIDCIDDGVDEKDCWELEINECEDDEYRCTNGQCSPKSFFRDHSYILDCFDGSDEVLLFSRLTSCRVVNSEMSLGCTDVICQSTPLTSSCVFNRIQLLLEAMLSSQDIFVDKNCWTAFKCLVYLQYMDYLLCSQLCRQNACIENIRNACPEALLFPSVPVLFGHVYFVYRKNDVQHWTNPFSIPFYICFNTTDYDQLLNYFTIVFLHNMKCVNSTTFLLQSNEQLKMTDTTYQSYHQHIYKTYKILEPYYLRFNYTPEICHRSNMYQCIGSPKCISIHRLMNKVVDCPHMDDEDIMLINDSDVVERIKRTLFQCGQTNKYIQPNLVQNRICDCEEDEVNQCDDEFSRPRYIKNSILFQYMCDGFVDLIPISVGNRTENDETECDWWECDNIYTSCNDIWNCPNGADETDCKFYLTITCSLKHHVCISAKTNKFICLPVEQANDGQIDCLGATDEPTLCVPRNQSDYDFVYEKFYCTNRSLKICLGFFDLCDGDNDCEHGDDERLCRQNTSFSLLNGSFVQNNNLFSDIERFYRRNQLTIRRLDEIYFKLHNTIIPDQHQTDGSDTTIIPHSSTTPKVYYHQAHCHHGIDLAVYQDKKTKAPIYACLCPPSYYGDQCQFQNQRVSITVQFRVLSTSIQTLFVIIISLIDDSPQRIIHSYEQITYLPQKDCRVKFNLNLLYANRPKDPTKKYAIHIDIYEKLSLRYRGSALLPVRFPFLPVQKMAFIVDIPPSAIFNDRTCSIQHECVHGKCVRYTNALSNLTFCQCYRGWSGRSCNIRQDCSCSSDSICAGVSTNNRPVCVCPVSKFGRQCLLTKTICKRSSNSTCKHGGQCIPSDDYTKLHPTFMCLCPNGYTGERCEIPDTRLILSFDQTITFPSSIFIHFVEVTGKDTPMRASTFRTTSIQQDSITVYWSQPFHLVFVELPNKKYYLTFLQNSYSPLKVINTNIHPANHCLHIKELFNHTFMQWHLIRRIKYYHLPCQNTALNLSCFYDDVHFCLCYVHRGRHLSNCFQFDHNMTMNCEGQSECENGAQCLQDRANCPTRSMCICPSCFYGKQCQFSTSGFGVSLDAILGYHILPNVTLTHQPLIIQMSSAITIIFMLIGLVNSILSLITFKNRSMRDVGCGIYLLGSSVITLLTITVFGLKYWILIVSQMLMISNELFLSIQCYTIDFLLQICLYIEQWLNACVAVERAVIAIKSARFNRKKSRKIAKIVTVSLILIIILSSIHDPMYRRLTHEFSDDNNGDQIKRIWCTIAYPRKLQIYNSFIYILHYSIPFMMNFISAIILINKKSRRRAVVHPEQTYAEHLREQLHQHRHVLTAPIVLACLALPRLIITFVSKCMTSTNDSWLFLIGYFISLVPSLLTFVIFVIPSKLYMQEFYKFIREHPIRMALRRARFSY